MTRSVIGLSSAEREVLACTCLDAELGISEIARRTRLREHTVQRALQRLKEAQIISRLPLIDLYPLGYGYYAIFFSVIAGEKQRTRMLQVMSATADVSWFAEFNGEYRYAATLVTQTHWQAAELFQKLIEQSGTLLIKKTLVARTTIIDVPRKHLSSRQYSSPCVISTPTERRYSLNDAERKILEAITGANFQSHRQIAANLGIPHTTFELRMKRLTENKIINGSVYSVDSNQLGLLTAKILVILRRDNKRIREKLQGYALSLAETFHYTECFGEWDCEITLDVDKSKRLSEICDELLMKFENEVSDVKILSGVKTFKRLCFPFAKMPG